MIVFLNQDLLYLEFDSLNETRRVLETGKRSFRNDFLQLKWWDPSVGCVSKKDQVKEAWIEIVGSTPLDKGDFGENKRQLRRFRGHPQGHSPKDRSVMGKNLSKIGGEG